MTRAVVVCALALLGLLAAVTPAGAADECEGLMVCIPVQGPWVVVPTSGNATQRRAEFQLTCPRGHIVGGLDARLSVRDIDVSFVGTLGSPVNPGITTSRSAVFVAAYTGRTGAAATFKPFIGCMPAAGGGSRVPTSVGALRPGQPVTRHVVTVRVRPGAKTVIVRCGSGERLTGASHAFGFGTRTPPSASLIASASGTQTTPDDRVVVRVHGDAELAGVNALVQVHAICARER